ncbi:hypothetical protein niasHT_032841 [Heterodera trifolii]|uniref:RING-type domain-containing protein n=1 Tax=Heterodera trifolii TaxID=157864 RepID=A0ABD2J1Y3_9BILA
MRKAKHCELRWAIDISPELRDGGRYACIWLDINFTNCAPNDPNATIKISAVNTNEWHEFVFPKWQLSARSEAIVLGFGIEPLAHKTFNLLNVNEASLLVRLRWAVSRHALIDYEMVLECNIRHPQELFNYENYVIGSEFYQHSVGGGPNFMITVNLYDIVMAQSCYGDGYGNENSIEITVRKNGDHLRTFLFGKSTFIETNTFELDMRGDAEVINFLPISIGNFEAGTSSNTNRQNTNFEAGTSSNSNRPPTSTVDDTDYKIDEKVDEIADKEIRRSMTCTICMENKLNFMFTPCMHACVCKSCGEKIMNSREPGAKKCPICRKKFDKVLPFFLP